MKRLTARMAEFKLKQLQREEDTERAHSQADDVLCQLLETLGHAEVVAEYRKVEKWFA